MMLFEIKSNSNMASAKQHQDAINMQNYIKNGFVNKAIMDNDIKSIKTFQQYLEDVMKLADQKKYVSPLLKKEKIEAEEEKKASEEDLIKD